MRKVAVSDQFFEIVASEPPRVIMMRIAGAVKAEMIAPADAEALGWSLTQSGSWLLTDDATLRSLAEALGVECHGSIGLVLANASLAAITPVEASALLYGLRGSSLWASERVFRQAKGFLDELEERS